MQHINIKTNTAGECMRLNKEHCGTFKYVLSRKQTHNHTQKMQMQGIEAKLMNLLLRFFPQGAKVPIAQKCSWWHLFEANAVSPVCL